MRLSLYIARRYLLGKKSRNAINIISGISAVGVMVGTMALVIVLSVFNGFDGVVKSLFSTFDPELKILATEGKTFVPDAGKLEQLRNMADVAGVSRVLEENVLLVYGDRQHIATVKGVDDDFEEVSGIDSMIYDGIYQLRDPVRPYAIVGQGVAYALNIGLNFVDPLFVYTIDRKSRINMAQPEESIRRKFIYPKGIFAIEQEFDSRYIIAPLEFVRDLASYPVEVSSLEVKLRPGADLPRTEAAIETLLGPERVVQNRQEQNALFYKVMRSEKWAIFLILTFILIIASFNIVGSLSMLIIDKTDDILTLRNMGAGKQLIERIFLVEGWLITLLGSGLGMLLGTGVAWIQQHFGLIRLSGSGTFVIDAYPVQIEGFDILLIGVTVNLIGLLAAWYPVKQISGRYLRGLEQDRIV
ncbi:MAG: FtsX-like permease family protein [Bacteroidales bacterium]